MSLKEYKKKRDFNKTKEPEGKIESVNYNRFVIQYHEATTKHYDFRLEYDGVLLSWAVPKGISLNPRVKRLAVHVEDHPVDYIDFEGVIPKGNYGAGSVQIYDSGNYLPIQDFQKGLKKGHIKFVLNGDKVKGGFSLVKTDEKNWLFMKLKDEYVNVKEKVKNIKLPFKKLSPQLATLSNTIPTGKNWLFEIKYDGYRIISFVENNKVKMLTRNGIDYTHKFEVISKSLLKLRQGNFVIDGEIVSFDKDGRSDFGLLQKNIKENNDNFTYVVFDLLALNGEDLRNLELIERKKKLELILAKSDDYIVNSTFLVDKGKECYNLAKEKNLEGIIAKNINSKYVEKRSDDWLKIKCYLRQEFVIAGYTTSEKNEILSALLLGYYEGDKLIYVGKVGTGFGDKDKAELNKSFKKLTIKRCPFDKDINEKNITWLSPKLVVEIQYTELTKEKVLRQPSFISLRIDKNPKDVKLEISHEKK